MFWPGLEMCAIDAEGVFWPGFEVCAMEAEGVFCPGFEVCAIEAEGVFWPGFEVCAIVAEGLFWPGFEEYFGLGLRCMQQSCRDAGGGCGAERESYRPDTGQRDRRAEGR